MEFAYSILNTKAFDQDEKFYLVKGIASTPTPDRSHDVVDPMGASFKIPMPLLWQHNHQQPVGTVTMANPTKDGIPFEAAIPKIAEDGALKNRIDEAVQSLKYGLVSAVSIGFRALEYSFLDNGGINFSKWEWMELSLVTIPAQPEAIIESVKSWDRQAIAASGVKFDLPAYRKSPGVIRRKPILFRN